MQRGGGAAANVAAWLARAGAPVTLIGRVGDDAAGRGGAEELRGGGRRRAARVDPERPTGTCVVLVEPGGERTMLPDAGRQRRRSRAAPLPAGRRATCTSRVRAAGPGLAPAARALIAARAPRG